MTRRRIILLVLIIVASAGAFFYDRSKTLLEGPESPLGYTVTIRCPDAGLGSGQLYQADIAILNVEGNTVSQWKDQRGQGSADGLREMIESMRWTSDSTLSFRSRPNQLIRLSVPRE
ncbi:MAG: hypothetical protein ACPG4K_07090 [Haloferula sp.]